MGVYIKGMKMPKCCFECDLYNDENNSCKAQKEYMPFASFEPNYKDVNCPMVEVSEPHGRLIDVNDAKSRMIPLSFSVQKWIDEVELSNCKIIIEQEGE